MKQKKATKPTTACTTDNWNQCTGPLTIAHLSGPKRETTPPGPIILGAFLATLFMPASLTERARSGACTFLRRVGGASLPKLRLGVDSGFTKRPQGAVPAVPLRTPLTRPGGPGPGGWRGLQPAQARVTFSRARGPASPGVAGAGTWHPPARMSH